MFSAAALAANIFALDSTNMGFEGRNAALALATIVGISFASIALLGAAWRFERLRHHALDALAHQTLVRMEGLSDVAAALSDARSRDAVSRAIVERGMLAAGADTAMLYELNEEGTALELLGERGVAEGVREGIVRITESSSNPRLFESFKNGETLWAESDADYFSLFPELSRRKVSGRRSRAFWSVPLVVEGRPVGLLGMGFYAPRRFSSDERAFVRTLTRLCAQALLRAHHLERERRLAIENALALNDLRQLQEKEHALRAEAEIASRAKDEFLSLVSHELRTPLMAILGWANILRSRHPEADVGRGLAVIERNARAQAKLIEDVLDVSRIMSGKLVLKVVPMDLSASIAASVEAVKPAAAAKDIAIDTDTGEPFTLRADASRMQQVFWNLLSNAVKFTPRGGRVSVASRNAGGDAVVTVEDTGEGVRPEALPFLFEPFHQVDGSTTRRHGGLGLGLAIVKQLVTAHGGSVSVDSRGTSTGATFTVRLPARAAAHASRQPAKVFAPSPAPAEDTTAPRLDGLRLLVVDDEEDARTVVAEVLRDCGAKVDTASSATEALEKFASSPPDVLVSDIGMPSMDGYALIRKIRGLSTELGGETPALALTGFARVEDPQKAFSAGYQMHLAKPTEPKRLANAVANLGGRSAEASG